MNLNPTTKTVTEMKLMKKLMILNLAMMLGIHLGTRLKRDRKAILALILLKIMRSLPNSLLQKANNP